MHKTTMLLIMDGFGLREKTEDNAIENAKKPNLDRLWAEKPHTRIQASGRFVGLPDGQFGNSEVGHTNMGAGRVVWQELSHISNEIREGGFFENEALNAAVDHVKKNGSALHVFGLMSDGGVHSHIEHIKGLALLAQKNGIEKLWVHCFMDGRDTAPTSGASYVKEMEEYLSEIGCGAIGSVIGRYYAMDRDKRWERIREAYMALTEPLQTPRISGSEAVADAYNRDETDEFIKARTCNGFEGIKDGDAIVFANFRPDRAREITRAFVDPEFDGFPRTQLKDLCYICMTQYDATMPNVLVAYPPQTLKNTLGEYVSSLGKSQLRIAETEKYAHVTFFFNGGVEAPYEGEDRILVASPKVATYDLQPEMSAYEVTDRVLERIEENRTDLIIMNLANCDMVGHTGVFEAAVAAVEAVDACVGRIVSAIEKTGGDLIITADHGNADIMVENGIPMTAHTSNPVPVILVSPQPYSLTQEIIPDSDGCCGA
ncbi:MAG: 2,3-bisphosphoglycerate-independent phosphoglycerate mutase, partial [Firmicutes bacterium]|nr:2,3-bisphosphoglycerate-independent phosphoglycerate mutase [Bacillota bacterium]